MITLLIVYPCPIGIQVVWDNPKSVIEVNVNFWRVSNSTRVCVEIMLIRIVDQGPIPNKGIPLLLSMCNPCVKFLGYLRLNSN